MIKSEFQRLKKDLKQWFKRGHTEEKYKPHKFDEKLTKFLKRGVGRT